MRQERLPVRKIREVILLHFEAGLSNRAAALAFQVSNSTVGERIPGTGGESQADLAAAKWAE
jgi:DNA-directed RNA polymerase specialized sigma24 family protein